MTAPQEATLTRDGQEARLKTLQMRTRIRYIDLACPILEEQRKEVTAHRGHWSAKCHTVGLCERGGLLSSGDYGRSPQKGIRIQNI